MVFEPGFGSALSVDGTELRTVLDSISFNRGMGTVEVTAFGDSDEEMLATIKSGGLNFAGHWDVATDLVLDGTFDGAVVAMVFGPQGLTTGDVRYTFNAIVEDYTQDTDPKGKVSFSGTAIKTGAVTRDTYP